MGGLRWAEPGRRAGRSAVGRNSMVALGRDGLAARSDVGRESADGVPPGGPPGLPPYDLTIVLGARPGPVLWFSCRPRSGRLPAEGSVMLQCPYCLVVGMEGDRTCYKCGRPYRPGLTQRGLSYTLAIVFACTMFAAILLVAPPSISVVSWVAGVVTTALFVTGAGLVGLFLGWFIGAFVCEC